MTLFGPTNALVELAVKNVFPGDVHRYPILRTDLLFLREKQSDAKAAACSMHFLFASASD